MYGAFSYYWIKLPQENPLKYYDFFILSKLNYDLIFAFFDSNCVTNFFAFSSFINFGKTRLFFLMAVYTA